MSAGEAVTARALRALPELLTPAEVGRMFRVDPKTVGRWAAAGRLHSIRTPGGQRRFLGTEIAALLDELSGSES